MKLQRSEFQVEEMNRVIAQKHDEDGWDTSNDDVQLRVQLSTLEAMNNELTNQLKEEKGARRMVEGKQSLRQRVERVIIFHAQEIFRPHGSDH